MFNSAIIAAERFVPAPYPTIQAAIDAAGTGDEVIIQPGVYYENINFLGKAITVRSTDPDDPAVVAATIINGSQPADPHFGSVVTYNSGEGNDSILTGLTITGGTGQTDPTVDWRLWTGDNGEGGGVFCRQSSPTITKNIIRDNRANYGGGGVWCHDHANPIISHNTLENNYAGWYGGGVFGRAYCSPLITDNTFKTNSCTYLGGGIYLADHSSAQVLRNRIEDNSTLFSAGGLYYFVSSNPTVACNIFYRNHAKSGASAIMASATSGKIINNAIAENYLANSGSSNCAMGFYVSATVTIANNIIYGNEGYGLHTGQDAAPTIHHNNLWNNTSGNYGGLLADLTGVSGNISADPALASNLPPPFTLHELNPGSPCINAGDLTALPVGLTTDFDGGDRLVGAAVDMGPQEFHALTVPDDFATIQSAINAAGDQDEIVVRCGCYAENINFSGKHIRLRSLDPLNDDCVQQTIIDGSGNDSCIRLISGEDETAALAGFRIQNGHGEFGGGVHVGNFSRPIIMYNYITNCQADRYGGGIDNRDDSQAVIQYNTIINNYAHRAGGGVHNGPGSWSLIMGNVISHNHTDGEAGGGIYAYSKSSVTVLNNVINNNRATLNGYGAGLWLWDNTGSLVERNIISGNFAEGDQGRGGGIGIMKGDVIVRNNLICGNHALRGGGVWIQNSTTSQIINNTVVGNRCVLTEGAGIGVAWSANPTIINNVMADNHPGGGIYATACSPIIQYNDLWNHADGNYLGDLIDLTGVNGNISANPLFVTDGGWDDLGTTDPNDDVWINGDYRLGYVSPCRDTALPAAAPALDYLGTARPQFAGPDIGAYELDGYDISGDGMVDQADLLLLAESWLMENSAFDANQDGIITLEEFHLLAESWLQDSE